MKINEKCWSIFIALTCVFFTFISYMNLIQHRESRQIRNQIISNQFAIVNNQKLIIENQSKIMFKFNVAQSLNPIFIPKE